MRTCIICAQPLTKKIHESAKRFAKRQCCSKPCGHKYQRQLRLRKDIGE